MKPDIPEWAMEHADDIGEEVFGRHERGFIIWPLPWPRLRESIARALLEAHRAGMMEAAAIGRSAFDDRPRRESMDWNDGFDDCTKAAEAAIRAKAEELG